MTWTDEEDEALIDLLPLIDLLLEQPVPAAMLARVEALMNDDMASVSKPMQAIIQTAIDTDHCNPMVVIMALLTNAYTLAAAAGMPLAVSEKISRHICIDAAKQWHAISAAASPDTPKETPGG